MIVLGIHTGHDGSICVVKDGRLVCAMAYERYRREKKSHGISDRLLDAVLAGAGITLDQVDAIGLSDWNPVYARDAIAISKDGVPVDLTWNMIFGNDVLTFDAKIRGRVYPAYNIGHHLCHCAAAFYTSPFPNAYCFSMDSSGGDIRSNSMVAFGAGTRLDAHKCPNAMIGLVYGEFCERLGLGSQMFKAGAMMGLAAYGTPKDFGHLITNDFVDNDYRAYVDVVWNAIAGKTFPWCCGVEQAAYREQADIAASMQLLFEESILRTVRDLPTGPLCLGGGSFLNCTVNSRIVQETGRQVHLFPACSDDGCAIGAALYVAHHMNNEQRAVYTDAELAYLGPDSDPASWMDAMHVANMLAAGKVVGWFQGRAECGPRALGNRSILADPRNPAIRDQLNQNVKKREWFRPFAPSVLAEESANWFDFPGPSPFMLMTAKVKQAGVPAITHVDGSSRMQTVTRETNPAYYELIAAFRDLTGVPMLLNTSFNGNEQPMVEDEASVRHALDTMPLDLCVFNGEIWER